MNNNLDNPFYYLENFAFVLDWVRRRYADLLDGEETAFVEHFADLPQQSQALLVRMVMRKGELFRAAKLRYEEIGPVAVAMAPLIAAGLVEFDPLLSLDQLFALLTRNELAEALRLTGAKGSRKGELYQAALLEGREAQRFSGWCGDLDQAYAIRIGALCDRIRLMFFGNLYQDWSEFVLSDLGIYTYEKVEFSAASRAFHVRADIDLYLHYQACRDRFHDGVDDEDVQAEAERLAAIEHDLMQPACANPWLRERRARLLFQIGQRCEQLDRREQALRLYAQCGYSGARLRRIRVLEKDGQVEAAMTLAQEALKEPESAAETHSLARSMPRLQRKLGMARQPAPVLLAAPRIDLVLAPPEEDVYVEEVARAHFVAEDGAARVFYVENALINSLFGLLCWEAIFRPVPGAFFHPFQSGPADLHSPDFRRLREAQFAACLAQLDTAQYRATIETNFARKAGMQSPFVFWGVLDEELLRLALDCIPPAHLAGWCERILQDVGANRSGFPDLIQFWPAERRYRMIEIKGPGDRLQDNQLRLIDFALAQGMPLEVCYIAWEGAA